MCPLCHEEDDDEILEIWTEVGFDEETLQQRRSAQRYIQKHST